MWVCVSTKPGATTKPDASTTRAATAPWQVADRLDAIRRHTDVGPDGSAAGAVDNRAVRDQDVEGRHAAHDTTRGATDPAGGVGPGYDVRSPLSERSSISQAWSRTCHAARRTK